jgi:F-type H+-transporting ATPase subunit b
MLIDWFTVIAQVINFLILVWLLKRFLYQPILNAIDAREKRIAAKIADADAKETEAQKQREEYQHKNDEFDQQRNTLLKQAADEAQAERQRLLTEAREAAVALQEKREESLRNEEQHLRQAISQRAQQEVFAIARKTLTDLAGENLEARITEIFVQRLREMSAEDKADFSKSFNAESDPVHVRSAFDLPDEQRDTIQQALNQAFSAQIRLRFEAVPELVSGIELTMNGQKLAWSIADYLASLDKAVNELLKQTARPEMNAAPVDKRDQPETKTP